MDLYLASSTALPVAEQPFEIVERKGLGHPDSICDSVMEAAAVALRREYTERCGRVLHHNLDKALLVAGQSEPAIGGGKVKGPIQITAGDRATNAFGDVRVPVDEIVEAAVRHWFRDSLRFVDEKSHIDFRSEIKPGSVELAGIFDRGVPVANDTSAAVGFAPLSETEATVLEVERYINSGDFKQRFPVAGEDVKVMAVRRGKQMRLTIAIAFVDRFVSTEADYFEQKDAIRGDVTEHVRQRIEHIEDVQVDINMLDDPALGQTGMYLTVLGTSAESGDGGEVGRGNAVNGLISLCRPTSNEAAAGKNKACHVGNIYNHLSHMIAAEIVESIDPVRDAYVWLCSQIGRAIDDPWSVSINVSLDPQVAPAEINADVDSIVRRHLEEAARASKKALAIDLRDEGP